MLTPNHFLTGKLTKYFSSNEFPQSDINNRKCWKSFWLLARIIDVHAGNDGIVTSYKIKLGNNILVRPCNKLCLLEEAD